MAFISQADAERVAAAITQAEAPTSGEIVTVVAAASDDYALVPISWAALAALSAPLPLYWLTAWSPAAIHAVQLGVFSALALGLRLGPVLAWVTPRGLQRRRAARHAREQFIAQGLHLTQHRTGVLIFVSVAEHYCEIIADQLIDEKVDDAVWRDAVDAMTAAIRQGRVAEGFIAAIGICGRVLAEHFPPDAARNDELPNHLIIIGEE